MTAYCLSSTGRTRPTAFVLACIGGERLPQQPVPPNVSVDTPDDEPLDPVEADDQGPPVLTPSKKRVPPAEESGLP